MNIFRFASLSFCVAVLTGCSFDKMLDIAPPLGVQTDKDLDSWSGAEAAFSAASGQLYDVFVGINSLTSMSGELSDEFYSSGGSYPQFSARRSTRSSSGRSESGNEKLGMLFGARSEMLLAIERLRKHATGDDRARIGKAFALIAFSELLLAEVFCPGAPLDRVLPGGGIEYGTPLTTDSLLGVAEAHFDSALAYVHGDTLLRHLARTGMARARLGRGHYAGARTAASVVPTNFSFEIRTGPGINGINFYYLSLHNGCSWISVSNREGHNGLDYVSAADPRLAIDSTIGITCDQYYGRPNATRLYYPSKFGSSPTSIPISTGIEARLIEAEAALRSSGEGGDTEWLTILNALRTSCTSTASCPSPAPAGSGNVAGLPLLTDPGTTAARVDLLFRERAFWLFGTGIRLGDMRRLIRQYGRSPEAVFPTGPNPYGRTTLLMTFGTDISITLPTPEGGSVITNPKYQGCMPEAVS